jgi:nicotinamide mononucleotide transporter
VFVFTIVKDIEYLKLFLDQLRHTTFLEYVGVGFGVLQVLMAKSNRVWLYPFGIISVSITLILLWQVGLYAEILLNLYYLIMSIYGWYLWTNTTQKPAIQMSKSTRSDWQKSIAIIAISFPLLSYVLIRFTDSNVPYMDAWVTATAWAGMWLLSKRKLENWLFLNLSNLIAIPLLAYKGLVLYALLTLFLFIVAIFGYFHWKKEIEQGPAAR